MSRDWNSWARKKGGRPTQTEAPRPADPPAPQLAPAPPGWAWAQTSMGVMLVQVAAPSGIPAAPRQPQQVVPYGHQPQPQARPAPHPGAGYGYSPPPESCLLVRSGGVDKYRELLSGVPDLVPPTPGYDAMRGQVNPLVAEELASLPEFNYRGDNAHRPEAPAIGRMGATEYNGRTMPALKPTAPAPPPAPNLDAIPPPPAESN